MFDDAEIRSDARRGARMIAGDHDDAYACPVRLLDRNRGLGARRIDDASRAHENQIALERFARSRFFVRGAGDRQRRARAARRR